MDTETKQKKGPETMASATQPLVKVRRPKAAGAATAPGRVEAGKAAVPAQGPGEAGGGQVTGQGPAEAGGWQMPGKGPGEAGGWQVSGEGGIETNGALQAYTSIRAELEALPASELVIVRVDLRRAGAIAHSVAVRDAAPERRAAFEKVAATGFYDIATLDDLPRIARGAWYVRRQQLRVLARASGAVVSEDDIRLGYDTRARMMRVLDHWLGDRRDIAEELDHVRAGTGHEDLATDLDTLAEVYQRGDVRPFIEKDTKHYRATDVTEARRLVDIIFASLGIVEAGEVERANALAQRAATLLLRTYDAHRDCGRFLFGGREDVEATYPSLIAAARSPRRKRKDDAPAGGDEPDAEGGSGDDVVDETPLSEVPVSAA